MIDSELAIFLPNLSELIKIRKARTYGRGHGRTKSGCLYDFWPNDNSLRNSCLKLH